MGPKTIEKLEAHGVTSIEKLADMTPEQLVEIPGIGEKMVEKIHQSVALYFEELEAQATAAPAEAAPAEAECRSGSAEASFGSGSRARKVPPKVAGSVETAGRLRDGGRHGNSRSGIV